MLDIGIRTEYRILNWGTVLELNLAGAVRYPKHRVDADEFFTSATDECLLCGQAYCYGGAGSGGAGGGAGDDQSEICSFRSLLT